MNGGSMSYILEPIEDFTIICCKDGKIWHQEVADAHLIVSDEIPDWIEVVVHRGVSDASLSLEGWTLTERKTRARINVSSYLNQEDVICEFLAKIRVESKENYDERVRQLKDETKGLQKTEKRGLRRE